jgi:hypothetical protein
MLSSSFKTLLYAAPACCMQLLLHPAVCTHQVCNEVEVEEHPLCPQHSCPEQWSWLLELHEGEQVHALILSLLKQGVDPTLVTTHQAQGVKVAQHAGNHAWHTGHGLKEEHTLNPLGLQQERQQET